MEIAWLKSRECPVVVVVSAMSGITDRLLELGSNCLVMQRSKIRDIIQTLHTCHSEAFLPLAPTVAAKNWIRDYVQRQFSEISAIAEGIRLLHEFSDKTRDKLISYGEILSSTMLARVLRDCHGCFRHSDARDWLVAEWTRHGSVVDFEETEKRARRHLLPLLRKGLRPVVPGFICRAPDGSAATLGRNGSDYSAAIVGAALRASEIWIYTDVDGIMTADPNLVAEASILDRISYQEAAEMSYFGAKVLHPKTMIPAVVKRIPIRIKNTFNPDAPGTLISDRTTRRPQVKTVTSVRNLALLNLQGNGMVGLPGVDSRLFGTLTRENVSIMMVSQSSSEHSISLVIRSGDSSSALRAIREEFRLEMERSLIEDVGVVPHVAIVAIIGAGMHGTPGISGKFFEALGKSRINVLAIAQGSSELNISAAIGEKDYRHAVQAIHSAFGLTRDLNIFLFGCGKIGRTLLKQIQENRRQLARRLEVNLKVLGVANSRHWIYTPGGLDGAALNSLGAGAQLAQLPGAQPRPVTSKILERIAGAYKSDVVLVDATGADLAPTHIEGLEKGCHIVTANKRPLTASLADYQTMQELCRRKGLNYQYEATFGAGLPLLSTLQDLIHTGDHILRIQGCLSGTLGFICSKLDEEVPFSEAVRDAMKRGYTEPDPRDDLSGLDVARKALIIARAMGAPLELEQIRLRALIPRRFFKAGSVERFLDALPSVDPLIRAECEKARKEDAVLRFLAEIDAQGCKVGLERVPCDSPIGRLAGPDNILVFQTQRYNEYPLVIQGPGAGASVTAAGVLSDLLKIAKWI
jgi:aspartokinase/homoserine dehydrogenase 1